MHSRHEVSTLSYTTFLTRICCEGDLFATLKMRKEASQTVTRWMRHGDVSEEGRCVSRAIYDFSRPQNELYRKYAMDWKHRRMPTSRSEKDRRLRIATIQGQVCILKRIDGGKFKNTLVSHFNFRHVGITLLIGDLPPDIIVLPSKDRQTC